MDAKFLKSYEKLSKASKKASDAAQDFADSIELVYTKLLQNEESASEEYDLEYTDQEIQEIVEKQIMNHPLYVELEKSLTDFEEGVK